MVGFLAAEYLIVANNPHIDPVLNKWLEKHCSEANKLPSDKQKADYLLSEIRKVFNCSNRTIRHPIRTRRFQSMIEQKGEYFLLGDFMNNRTGNCRHHWCLMQLALQEVGIIAAPMVGIMRKLYANDGQEFIGPARHIATLAILDGQRTLLDSAQEKPISIHYRGDALDAESLHREGKDLRLSSVVTFLTGNLRFQYQGQNSMIDAFLFNPLDVDQDKIKAAIDRSPQHSS